MTSFLEQLHFHGSQRHRFEAKAGYSIRPLQYEEHSLFDSSSFSWALGLFLCTHCSINKGKQHRVPESRTVLCSIIFRILSLCLNIMFPNCKINLQSTFALLHLNIAGTHLRCKLLALIVQMNWKTVFNKGTPNKTMIGQTRKEGFVYHWFYGKSHC